jgi:hypothetical protein
MTLYALVSVFFVAKSGQEADPLVIPSMSS